MLGGNILRLLRQAHAGKAAAEGVRREEESGETEQEASAPGVRAPQATDPGAQLTAADLREYRL